MKIILNQDVKHLGEEGDIKDVAAGYARNYLFPRNLALPCNDVTVAYFEGKKEEIVYAWTNEEKENILKDAPQNTIVQRYKGLGEMNADQLWDTTMNPLTRNLIQVRIEDEADAEKQIDILMGDDASRRRNWLESNVSFTLEDEMGE